jgi:hypothetical protein
VEGRVHIKTVLVFFALLSLAACGPDLGSLQKGERGKVARANAGAAIELEGGKGVFLAEIGAPRRGDPYAENARADLEALAVNRPALLAYGGERTWTPRARTEQNGNQLAQANADPPRTFAIAHVFVESEGGRWIWLQHALVTRGAAWVRPRANNHARIPELLEAEARARAAHRGLWNERTYRILSVADAANLARESAQNCARGAAPYRLVEGEILRVARGEGRASLIMREGEAPFELVLFGDAFKKWDGPALESFTGKYVVARGPLGVFHDAPQLCLEQSSALQLSNHQPR